MLDTSSHLYYNVSDFTVADAEGLYVRDEDGNEFMDCSAGTFNLSLGYRHPAVVQAIKDQADKLIHVSSREGVLGVLPGDLFSGRWHGRCLPPAVMYGRTLRQQHGHG